MNREASFFSGVAALFVLCCLWGYSAQAQTTRQADDNQIIQSLLNEVRLLRKTLQRTGLNAYRSQIIVEGVRAHNEQVVRLTRMVEDARREMEDIDSTIPRMIERNKMMETLIEQEADANKRLVLEFENKERKADVERYKGLLERSRQREQQLSAQLRDEKAKLSDLESRLDSLEREIESEIDRLRTEDASQDGKKRP